MLITITYKVMSVLLKKSYNREEKLELPQTGQIISHRGS